MMEKRNLLRIVIALVFGILTLILTLIVINSSKIGWGIYFGVEIPLLIASLLLFFFLKTDEIPIDNKDNVKYLSENESINYIDNYFQRHSKIRISLDWNSVTIRRLYNDPNSSARVYYFNPRDKDNNKTYLIALRVDDNNWKDQIGVQDVPNNLSSNQQLDIFKKITNDMLKSPMLEGVVEEINTNPLTGMNTIIRKKNIQPKQELPKEALAPDAKEEVKK